MRELVGCLMGFSVLFFLIFYLFFPCWISVFDMCMVREFRLFVFGSIPLFFSLGGWGCREGCG